MMITTRFGKKLKVPSTFQIKHQLLRLWLKDQVREAAEDKIDERLASGDRAMLAEGPIHTKRLTPSLLAGANQVVE
jgi:hypothetical protein